MKKLALAFFAAAPLLFGCASTGPSAGPLFANEFTFVVKDVDVDTAMVYLNSKESERDPRQVTVAIERGVLKELKARYGDNFETVFLDKTVHVQGRVITSRVLEPAADHRTGPVGYRKMVVVERADQIQLI